MAGGDPVETNNNNDNNDNNNVNLFAGGAMLDNRQLAALQAQRNNAGLFGRRYVPQGRPNAGRQQPPVDANGVRLVMTHT